MNDRLKKKIKETGKSIYKISQESGMIRKILTTKQQKQYISLVYI